jgi:mono/diheme cytochrome c family protein
MTTNEIILAVVGAVLVVFSLVVALVVPKRSPGFPSRRMGVFFGVSIALVAGMLATVEVVGAEEDEEQPAAEAPPGEPPPGEPSPGEPPPPGEPAPPPPQGDPADGSEVFASQACGSCHVLADAGTSGTVGPNLDESQPPYDLVIDRVTNGSGAMPSFSDRLSEQQIQDVAAYVVQATSA